MPQRARADLRGGRRAAGVLPQPRPLNERLEPSRVLREPCAIIREGRGEASVAVRVGSDMKRRNKSLSGVPRRFDSLKATRATP